MKRWTMVAAAALFLIASGASADEIYKCRSANGAVSYGPVPCPPGRELGRAYVERGKPASSQVQRLPSDPIEAANALAEAYKRQAAAVEAGAFSTEPPPLPTIDESRFGQITPGAVTPESVRAVEEGPGPRLLRESGSEGTFGIVVVIVVIALGWGLIKFLVALLRPATRAAAQAAVEIAPTVKHAANRVGDTAAVRTKGFFAETRKCPYCAESIKKEAIVCRFCHRSLS